MFAFSAETLLKVLFGDETGVVDVKVMEREMKVVLSNCLSAVYCHCEELGVVNLTVVVEVNSLENLVDFFWTHVQFVESSPDFTQLQSTRIVSVKCAERVSQFCEVESTGIDLVHQKGKSFNLEALGLAEVLDTSKNGQFVLVKKSWVVSSMVGLNVVRGEPRVLKTCLG